MLILGIKEFQREQKSLWLAFLSEYFLLIEYVFIQTFFMIYYILCT
ncbi:hypothetical protein OL548_20415 [Lysinibacillus sp. MHQ-1]|nr:hypothetical protein OL548_20415 [Lysinibacillus sp. MHQ-1]